jgi:hypothetical protein
MPFKLGYGASAGGSQPSLSFTASQSNGAPESHLGIRFLITENNGGGLNSIVEIEMRSTMGGPDQCNGGAVIYSSQNPNNNPDNLAAAAFDNSTATKWTSLDGTIPAYIGYIFSSPIVIAEVAITCNIGGQEALAPKNIEIQATDDGITWYTIGAISNQVSWGILETRIFTITSRKFSGDISIHNGASVNSWSMAIIRASDAIKLAHIVISGETYAIDTYGSNDLILLLFPHNSADYGLVDPAAIGPITA